MVRYLRRPEGVLVSFFMMLVAFSTQDHKKLQVVADSMHDVFGHKVPRPPMRPRRKNAAQIDPSDVFPRSTPMKGRERIYSSHFKHQREFALAVTSLRQAVQDGPQIAQASKHIMFEQTKQGG